MCPEDFDADALLHVSVFVKRIFLFYLTFNCAYILLLLFTGKCIDLYPKKVTCKTIILYMCPIASVLCIRYRLWIFFIK